MLLRARKGHMMLHVCFWQLRFEFFDIECTNGNCLTKANLDTAYALVNDASAINVTFRGEKLYFDKLCYKRGSDCWRPPAASH